LSDIYSRSLNDKELDSLVETARLHCSKRRDQIQRADRFRFMQQKVDIPEAYRKTAVEVKNAMIFDMTQRVAAVLLAKDPSHEAPPAGVGEKYDANSTLRERWTAGAVSKMRCDNGRDTFARAVTSQCARGLAVYKLDYRPDRWSRFPVYEMEKDAKKYLEDAEAFKRNAPFPFSWKDVDAETWYDVRDEDGIAAGIEVTERPILELMDRFGHLDVSDFKSALGERFPVETSNFPLGFGTTRFEEIRTRNTIYYRVNGKTVQKIKHDYNHTGYFPVYCITTESNKPELESLPVTFGLLNYAPVLDMFVTMLTQVGINVGFPTGFLETPEDADILKDSRGKPLPFEWQQGDINTLLPGQTINFPFAQAANNVLMDALETMMKLIGRVDLPESMRGMLGSDWSGYLLNTLYTAVLSQLATVVRNHEQALEDMVTHLWRLVELKVQRKVPIWAPIRPRGGRWVALGPDDIFGYYQNEVHISPTLPKDEAVRAQTAIQLVQAGLISEYEARADWLGLPYPEETQERIDIEKIRNSDEVQMLRVQEMMRQLGAENLGVPEPEGGGQPTGMPPLPGAPMMPGVGQPVPGQGVPALPGPGGVGGRPAGAPQAIPSGPQGM